MPAAGYKENITLNKLESSIQVVDATNLLATFASYCKTSIHQLFVQIGIYCQLPLFICVTLFSIISNCIKANKKRDKSSIANACLEILGNIAISVAVIGGSIASASFALIAPIIFISVLGIKFLHAAGTVIYHTYHRFQESNPIKKSAHDREIKKNLMSIVTLTLVTVSIGGIMLAGSTAFAFVGIAAGVIALGMSIKGLIHHFHSSKAPSPKATQTTPCASSAMTMETNSTRHIMQNLPLTKAAPTTAVSNGSHSFFQRASSSGAIFREQSAPNPLSQSATSSLVCTANSFFQSTPKSSVSTANTPSPKAFLVRT